MASINTKVVRRSNFLSRLFLWEEVLVMMKVQFLEKGSFGRIKGILSIYSNWTNYVC